MLTEFGPDIWIADGPKVVAALGFHYPTRMVVIRLGEGSLFVWSPIAMTESLRAQVDSLGPVSHLVAPNSLHHVFLADWQRAYPDARAYAPPGLRDKRKDIDFQGDLSDEPAPAWAGEIEQAMIRGNAITTEIVFFHIRSRAAIFTDLLQRLPAGWYSGWRAVIAKWDLMLESEPSVPRKFHLAFTNRRAARIAIERVLSWPADKVLKAHGAPIESGGQAQIGRAFRWLTG